MWIAASLIVVAAIWFGNSPSIRPECKSPCVPGTEDLMKRKAHGTSETPVQAHLRWGCGTVLADRICVSFMDKKGGLLGGFGVQNYPCVAEVSL